MTEKRFLEIISLMTVKDNQTGKEYKCEMGIDEELLDLLNELHEENEQLKQAYTQLKHRHSLLHDVCIDAECDRDSYRNDIASLEKENEQLKQEKDYYKRELQKELVCQAIIDGREKND